MGKTILVAVAHSDDQVMGPGGAIAKYAAEGYDILTLIFSWGEFSPPHIKKEILIKMRVQEAQKADKIMGGNGVVFFGASDGKIKQQVEALRLKEKLKNFMLKHKPEKIFTHAVDEYLPDHVAVYNMVCDVYDDLHKQNKLTCDVYSFAIWRFLKWKQRSAPKLVVDISKTFDKKVKALNTFKSQKHVTLTLNWSVYLKAFVQGFKHNVQFAEVFNKVR